MEAKVPAATESRNSEPTRRRIGIAGAGIGGLALATRLSRLGYHPVVLEARSEEALRTEGAFLTLAPNGMNALRAIGAFDAVREAGIETGAIELHDERGRTLATIDQRNFADAFGAECVSISRSALMSTLLEAAMKAGVIIRFGHRITRVESAADSVLIEVASGEREQFDILCGCDGLRSTVRSQVFPACAAPAYTGLVGSGGFVDVAELAPTGGTLHMVFGKSAFFGFMKAPQQPVYWFDSYPLSEEQVRAIEPTVKAGRLRTLHAGDPAPVKAIVENLRAIEHTYPIYDLPNVPCWSHDRVVLMGDAAHAAAPSSGQGASMALEDAMVLAACLVGSTHRSEAFKNFERLRRRRTDAVIRLGRMSGSPKKAQSQFSLLIRNLLLPLFIALGARTQRRFMSYRADQFSLVCTHKDSKAIRSTTMNNATDRPRSLSDTELRSVEKGLSWYGWGSPVGLGIFLVATCVCAVLLRVAVHGLSP